MEGYTNINANLHNFDDLDIEGRIVDDWNQDEECPTGIKKNEHRRILETKVRLDDGSYGEMCSVVKKQNGFSYTCHICTTTCSGWPQFKTHLESSKHIQYMQLPEHPRNKFVKLDPNEDMALEPGEPVPPGLEEVVISNCQIQPVIDNYRSGPLIGLEYLVEINNGFEELEYTCLLCDKVGKSRSIMGHMTSQGHYRKYIATFFRDAVKLYNEDLPRNNFYRQRCVEVVTRIARKIESKYGRMKPRCESASSFISRKYEVIREIEDGHHFRQGPDDRFDDCLLVTTDPGSIYKGSTNTGDKDLQTSTYSLKDGPTDVSHTKITNKNEAKNIPMPQVEIMTKKNTLIDEKSEISSIHKGDELSKSLFNKGKINADKRQLRSRDESNGEKKSSSPEIVQVDLKPPSVKKYRRSHSVSPISLSTDSRSSSRSKSRGRSITRTKLRSPNRSRARSPYRSRYRSRSRNRSYGSRYVRRSRSSSVRRYRMRRRSRSRGRYRSKSRSRSRSPSYADKFGRTISLKRRDSSADYRSKKRKYHDRHSGDDEVLRTEKRKWEKFREEYHEVETALYDKLKYFEKNPEKHPQYPEEWKVFWNKRYKEIQSEGKDPAKHDFKPEWIVFWTKRMKEIHEHDLETKKEALKLKYNLPSEEKNSNIIIKPSHCVLPSMLEDVSPPTPDKKDVIADIKNTWKALTGSEIKESKRPLSPWEEESKPQDQPTDKGESRSDHYRVSHRNRDRSQEKIEKRACFIDNVGTVVSLLRKLAVLEGPLGSLGPRVLDLLSVALAMDKVSENGSQALLYNNEHCVFLETVKEKLKGLLFAGVVARNMVNTTRSAIRSIDHLFADAPKYNTEPFGKHIMIPMTSTPFKPEPEPDPVSVPGVGKIDKIAIAQQIAATLIQQGRTNVTEGELEQLINAVIGMAEASSHSGQPISAAAYVSQMQFTSGPLLKTEFQNKPSVGSGLTLLQSAYDEIAKPDVINLTAKAEQIPSKQSNRNTVTDLSESDLKNLIENFNDLSSEEKIGLKSYLKKLEESSPEIIMKLKPIMPQDILTSSVFAKRSTVVIPIPKEKSEQKIKPVEQETGRLSPFSMRTGGINPTADTVEHVLTNPSNPADDSPDDDKLLAKYVGDDNDDDDDDEDDDDYSFEDVYKAASEKLRLKQIEEEKTNEAKKVEKSLAKVGSESEILTDSIEISKSLKSKETNLSQLPEVKTAIQTKGDSISTLVKPQEYQVNINNYAQFAPISKTFSSQQDAVSELYPDNIDCLKQNYPNYSQRINYPSGPDLETGVVGHNSHGDNLNYNLQPNQMFNRDVQETAPDHESQGGYVNHNVQTRNTYNHNPPQDTAGFDSQVSYPIRNQQSDFAPNHNLRTIVSLDSQSGYSNSNLQSSFAPSRDTRYNIPSRFDVQNTFTTNGPGEEGFYANRNHSTLPSGNYPSGTSFQPSPRDQPTDFPSNQNFLPNRNNTYPARYSDFDNGGKYTSRPAVNMPYCDPPVPHPQRESESQFYPNHYPPNNQPFKRFQNIPRF